MTLGYFVRAEAPRHTKEVQYYFITIVPLCGSDRNDSILVVCPNENDSMKHHHQQLKTKLDSVLGSIRLSGRFEPQSSKHLDLTIWCFLQKDRKVTMELCHFSFVGVLFSGGSYAPPACR